jgi:hypothetical protein
MLPLSYGFSNNAPTGTSRTKHPFYVSVTEINHNKNEKALEISCKIFTDDFEAALKQIYKKSIAFSAAKQQPEITSLVPDYLSKRLRIAANEQLISLKFIGFEKDNEAVYCYFEGQNVPSADRLNIENTILQDYTKEQINIVHAVVNGKRQSSKLDISKTSVQFKF